MNYQSSLARARGLGSARDGMRHWWRQRVTAVALIPLSLWLALSVAWLPGTNHTQLIAWVSHPWHALLLLSFSTLGFIHAMLGIQVVIEDYIHSKGVKMFVMLGAKLALGFAALAAGFAVLRIAVTG